MEDRVGSPVIGAPPLTSIERPAGVEDRSIPELFRRLADESRTLVREEMALAKAEMREKMEVYQRNAARIGVGSAFLLAALLFVLWAVNTAVTALFATFMELEIAVWLAPVVLGVLLGLIGWSMVKRGKSAIAEEGVVPRKTARSLKEDTRWVKERVQHG
jgi:hypothetical protein